ncbi:hypothetical protein [Chryseobacterium caseinilyticum]|uniref:Lipoprotein n=1 Tax=Chryseobacterium caseinilyticum TaxID=2771428 RepID=A0ABR8Z9X3_9FLAO|nr:hypothetical protein [Chryseobacterium caseinilyticum]MBD8081899.1 hypothetical protein [Chryseobacterium caseinilyticum]
MKKVIIYLIVIFLFSSCKREEKISFDNGKIKFIKSYNKGVIEFKRFDEEGSLLFYGKFKNNQLIDTLYVFNKGVDFIIKIDSSDNNYFYGTYISKYSTGKNSKISSLRFDKDSDIDSTISSSLLFGKEILFNVDGKLSRERVYEIDGKKSEIIEEKIYDKNLK